MFPVEFYDRRTGFGMRQGEQVAESLSQRCLGLEVAPRAAVEAVDRKLLLRHRGHEYLHLGIRLRGVGISAPDRIPGRFATGHAPRGIGRRLFDGIDAVLSAHFAEERLEGGRVGLFGFPVFGRLGHPREDLALDVTHGE